MICKETAKTRKLGNSEAHSKYFTLENSGNSTFSENPQPLFFEPSYPKRRLINSYGGSFLRELSLNSLQGIYTPKAENLDP